MSEIVDIEKLFGHKIKAGETLEFRFRKNNLTFRSLIRYVAGWNELYHSGVRSDGVFLDTVRDDNLEKISI